MPLSCFLDFLLLLFILIILRHANQSTKCCFCFVLTQLIFYRGLLYLNTSFLDLIRDLTIQFLAEVFFACIAWTSGLGLEKVTSF